MPFGASQRPRRVLCAFSQWVRRLTQRRGDAEAQKAKEQVTAVDKLKVLTYLRLLNLRLGLVTISTSPS
jgi:hypothetical protein